MRKELLLLMFALTLPVMGNSMETRVLKGIEYFLYDDFDTADGECVLRGNEYAGSFTSTTYFDGPVAELNIDGSLRKTYSAIEAKDQEIWAIAGLSCE